jgi:phage shock protein E
MSNLHNLQEREASQREFETMNWTISLIIVAVFAIIFFLKRIDQISPKDALAHLKNGALVIDVRSPGEFNSGHLPNAINLPLGELETTLPRRVKDKNQVLLLHCHSGMRSGMAKKKLKALGYANAFNLGSYGRAAKISSSR